MALELKSSGAATHLFEEINFEVGNNRCATTALELKSSGRGGLISWRWWTYCRGPRTQEFRAATGFFEEMNLEVGVMDALPQL